MWDSVCLDQESYGLKVCT